MTENEAIDKLNNLHYKIVHTSFCNKVYESEIEALCMAKDCLKEIQQYRTIGTIEGYENAIKVYTETYILMKEYKSKVQDFESIGTIEEFKALKEKEERFDRNIKMFNEIGLKIRAKAIDGFASTLIPRLTDAIYPQDVASMTNLIKEIAEQMKAGGKNEID